MDDFSLFANDGFNRVLARLGMGHSRSNSVARRILLLWCLTWLPTALLAAASGVAVGPTPRESYLLDFAAYAQLWLGLPLMLLAEPMIDRRLQATLHEFVTSGLVDERERGRFDRAIMSVVRAKNWHAIDFALIVVVYLSTITGFAEELTNGTASWHGRLTGGGESATFAGIWACAVAVPVWFYATVRWMWKIALWVWLLFRVSLLRLRIVPTHPDLCGGLRFLGEMQGLFGVLIFGMGSVVAAMVLYKNFVEHSSPSTFATQVPIWTFVLLAPAAFLAPLFLFSSQLYAAKLEAITLYAPVAAAYARGFEQRWILSGRYRDGGLSGDEDVQSLGVMSAVFANVTNMKIVPFDLQTAVRLVATAVGPMVPVIASNVPAIRRLVDLLVAAGGGRSGE